MISGDETKLPLASGEYQVQCKCGSVHVYMARAGIWLGGHAVEARVQRVKMHFYKGHLGVEVGDSGLPKLAFGPIGLWRS